MILSDISIIESVEVGHISIAPFDVRNVQPSTYDIRIKLDEPLTLIPLKLYRRSTVEHFIIPPDIQGQLHGRSSLGRLGTLIHVTAGLIDPGFIGDITLEIVALTNEVTLWPNDRVGQISFHQLDRPCLKPYNGRYQNQSGDTPSRFTHD